MAATRDGGTIAVLLNYRTAPETVAAVRSLSQSTRPLAAIIVVDNDSGDGSPDLIARELPRAHLIVAERNDGFSAGCNLGIREALRLGADRVLLLNSDVIVPPDAVGALERALTGHPGVGIVGPILVDASDAECVQSMGIRYSRRTGRMRHLGFGLRRSAVSSFDVRDVDGVSGCAMLVTREVFDQIGLLAEEYFFGFEDLDFCLRARAAGFRTACVGTAIVRHEGSASMGRTSAKRTYFAVRNHLLLASRMSAGQSSVARAARAASILSLNLAHLLLTSDVPRRTALRAFLRGIRDHVAGQYGDARST